MKHQEVVKFAMGLTEDKERMMDFVYGTFVQHLLQHTELPKYVIDPEASFLKNMLGEVPELDEMNAVSNKYISFLNPTDTLVHIPSRLYVFVSGIDYGSITYKVDQSQLATDGDVPPAESIIILECEILETLLNVIKHIQKHQKVFVSYLDLEDIMVGNDVFSSVLEQEYTSPFGHFTSITSRWEKPTADSLQISENLRTLKIWVSKWQKEDQAFVIFGQIMGSARGCKNLDVLTLTDQLPESSIPSVLTTFLAAMKSLRILHLSSKNTSPALLKYVSGPFLSNHPRLEDLKLSDLRVQEASSGPDTDPDTDPEYNIKTCERTEFSLKSVEVSECKIPLDIVGSMMEVLSRCPKLCKINLNDTEITGTFWRLLNSNHKFPHVRTLWMEGCKLNNSDIVSLCAALRANTFSQLETLNLARNKLTGHIRNMLCGPERGLMCLQNLCMSDCEMNRGDVTDMTKAVGSGKLPTVKYIQLSLPKGSNYNETKELIQAFIAQYKGRMVKLDLRGIDSEFHKNLKSLCEGTQLYLVLHRDYTEPCVTETRSEYCSYL